MKKRYAITVLNHSRAFGIVISLDFATEITSLPAHIPLYLVLALITTLAPAAEILVFEDFEKMDLKKLPPGWSLSKPEDFSIVDEPGRGKVLKISHQGNGWPALTFNVDPAKVKGHLVRVSASVKMPAAFKPLPGQPWARPKFYITYKDKSGADQYHGGEPEAKPGWQDLFGSATLEKDVGTVTAALKIDLVAAEIFFDDFAIEIDPDLNQPPPKGTAKPAAAPVADTKKPTTTPGKPAPAASNNDALAGKAPKKTFEDGGIVFSPEIATHLQKNVKAGANKNTLLMVGPGLPQKDLDNKLPEKWTRIAAPKELAGVQAAPRSLLAMLPKFLVEHKPEVVVIVPEMAPGRKLSSTEQYDWEDLARICQRLGAVPIIAVPVPAAAAAGAADAKDDLHTSTKAAVTDSLSPAIDMKAPTVAPRRLAAVLDLLDKHVYCRTPLEAPAPGVTDKKPEEE